MNPLSTFVTLNLLQPYYECLLLYGMYVQCTFSPYTEGIALVLTWFSATGISFLVRWSYVLGWSRKCLVNIWVVFFSVIVSFLIWDYKRILSWVVELILICGRLFLSSIINKKEYLLSLMFLPFLKQCYLYFSGFFFILFCFHDFCLMRLTF